VADQAEQGLRRIACPFSRVSGTHGGQRRRVLCAASAMSSKPDDCNIAGRRQLRAKQAHAFAPHGDDIVVTGECGRGAAGCRAPARSPMRPPVALSGGTSRIKDSSAARPQPLSASRQPENPFALRRHGCVAADKADPAMGLASAGARQRQRSALPIVRTDIGERIAAHCAAW